MLKRFFTLAALLMLAMTWTSVSARWVVGERKSASQIEIGDTVVIKTAQNKDLQDYYLQAADADHQSLGVMVAPGMGLGAAAIITIEKGQMDIRTGEPTVMLKLVGSDKYVGANYYDWYNNGQGASATPDKAGNFQIISCGEEIPWYDETRTDDFTYWTKQENYAWDDKSVGFAASPKDNDFCYLAYWTYASSSPRAITWKYTSNIQWDVYSVTYEKDLFEDLQDLINTYSTSSSDFQGGTIPGFYDQSIIDAYNTTLEQAMLTLYNPASTDEELQNEINDLKNAYQAMVNSLIPVSEGYYYIVCDNQNIINNNKPEKAMYINESLGQVYWGEFDSNDSKFVFHITPYDNTQWNVQNVITDLYLGVPSGFCKPFGVSIDKETPSTFYFYPGTGSCYIKSIAVDGTRWTMCPQGNASGTSDGPSSVWSYNGETIAGGNVPHHEWTWQLRKITDQAVLDRILGEKEQYNRTNTLIGLTQQASDLYDKLFDYQLDPTKGLITNADAQLKFSHIRTQGVPFADKPEYLTDGFDSTYVQASGYVDIAIDSTPAQEITFTYHRRAATQQYPQAAEWGENERPGNITILATNDTVNGGNWTKIADINMGNLDEPIMKTVDLGAPYSFIRYQVNTSKSGGSYFTFSEFQLYTPTVNESTSQYYTEEGMKDAADALKALLNSQKEAIANNTVTDDDIQALLNAYNAVKSHYADAEVLNALIKECNEIAGSTTVGDAIGQVDSEDVLEEMIFAIIDAETIAAKGNLSKKELDNTIQALTAARDKFISHVKSFDAGKWYYIVSNDKNYDNTNKALYTTGYSSSSTIGVGLTNEDGSPAYEFDPRAMWTFTATEGGYTVQNLGSGYYLGDFVKKDNALLQSYQGVNYSIQFLGAGSYALIPQSAANLSKYGVTANADKTNFTTATAETASSWKIIEIDPEELQFITIKDFNMNAQDVIVLPYNLDNINEFNDDVHIYGIKSITQDAEGTSTIEFYEKESAQAGEACWIVLGNPEAESESYELLIPFPTTITNKATGANGLYGMLHPENIATGDVFSTGKELTAATNDEVTISAHTGAIIPKYYTGPVSGVETALTLTVTGMGPLPSTRKGDINHDGSINATDVVCIYNNIILGDESGISRADADINGDDQVNASDVVALYNIIIGTPTNSPAFQKIAARILGNM